jgi:hypothetical protein
VTWTYGGDPTDNDRDAVRFLAGLTNKRDPLISDEEIAYLLAETGNDVYESAARALEQLATQFARLAETTKLGDRAEEYGNRSAKFKDRAAEVIAEGGTAAAGVKAPQIYTSSRDAALADTSRVSTQFEVGMLRNRGTDRS